MKETNEKEATENVSGGVRSQEKEKDKGKTKQQGRL
jgi:hypothetical protein